MHNATRKFFGHLINEHHITTIASAREVLDTINMPTLKAIMGDKETSSVGICYDEIRCDVDIYYSEDPLAVLGEIILLESL